MKVIVIDPYKREVREQEVPDSRKDMDGFIKALLGLLNAELFDVVRIGEGDHIYVDDEGLYTKHKFFRHVDYPDALAGVGVVVGHTADGWSIAPDVSVEQVRKDVTWMGNL